MKSSMISESKLINAFKHLFLNKLPLSISGESGTGKTTLALYSVGNLLTSEEKYSDFPSIDHAGSRS